MTMTLTHRFTSKEAAAKAWASPYNVVGRPGGYLHTPTAREYADLPRWLQAMPHTITAQVQRLHGLVDPASGQPRSIHGWHDLATVLMLHGLVQREVGPKGGTLGYWLAP